MELNCQRDQRGKSCRSDLTQVMLINDAQSAVESNTLFLLVASSYIQCKHFEHPLNNRAFQHAENSLKLEN